MLFRCGLKTEFQEILYVRCECLGFGIADVVQHADVGLQIIPGATENQFPSRGSPEVYLAPARRWLSSPRHLRSQLQSSISMRLEGIVVERDNRNSLHSTVDASPIHTRRYSVLPCVTESCHTHLPLTYRPFLSLHTLKLSRPVCKLH